MAGYTRRQILTLVVFCICQLCNAICISLQAPFYPAEAESKGAVASQYGFVFGIYELVVFIMSPIYGKYMEKLGVKLVNNTGIFTVAITCFLFGLLDKIEGTVSFITFSFVIRIVEATGSAAFSTAAFSIIAKEFPENVGTAFATLETFFGIGLILGPTIGGLFYEIGGFMLPFVVVSSLLFIAGILVLYLLPSQDEDTRVSMNSRGLLCTALKDPAVQLCLFTVAGASISIGFLQATLEPHLRPLGLSPFMLGLMFVLNGATYAISAPIWGKLCDHYIGPRTACVVGSLFVVISFLIVGPAPFLQIKTSISLCIAALFIHGLGFGAELVATFTGLHKELISKGFPNDIRTYSLVSGLWSSSFALGCFIGPSAAGILFDRIGFPWAATTVVGLHLLIFMLTILYMCIYSKKNSSRNQECQSLLHGHNETVNSQPITMPINRPKYNVYGSLLSMNDLYLGY